MSSFNDIVKKGSGVFMKENKLIQGRCKNFTRSKRVPFYLFKENLRLGEIDDEEKMNCLCKKFSQRIYKIYVNKRR